MIGSVKSGEVENHSSADAEIYRRTMIFVVAAAVHAALPRRAVYSGHSLSGAYYYTFTHGPQASEDEITALKTEIRRLIELDAEIRAVEINFGEAVEYFEKNKQKDTALLIRQRGNAFVKVNTLNGFTCLYCAPLLNRAGLLPSSFDVSLYREGFLLRFPPPGGGTIREFTENPKIFSAYNEYKKWGRITGVRSAGHINKLIEDGAIDEFIRLNEAFHAKKLIEISDEIYARRGSVKLVLIAGPSSSGKTTTAKRLSVYLKVFGIEATIISLDDYYMHPDKAPKNENGQPDLECLEALDVDYFNTQMLELFDGKEVTLPAFDFKTGLRGEGRKIRLGKRRETLIVEGIHGLNGALTRQIAAENKFKIYVSVLTQAGVDSHNRVSAGDNRLLRRIVRDNQFRGTSALRTLAVWDSVQRGAEKHIFRFEGSADAVFNSSLDYEMPVLKFCAEHLLRGINPQTAEYGEAERLLAILDNFNVLPPQAVPSDSILREFIGGSCFKY
jgi:uridine kinase